MGEEERQVELTKKERAIKSLEFFRDSLNNYIDDLPTKAVSEDDPKYYQYKCRTNWWNPLLFEIALLEKYGLIDERVKEDVDNFKILMRTIDWSKFRTKEEIDKANDFLKKIISYLETKVQEL